MKTKRQSIVQGALLCLMAVATGGTAALILQPATAIEDSTAARDAATQRDVHDPATAAKTHDTDPGSIGASSGHSRQTASGRRSNVTSGARSSERHAGEEMSPAEEEEASRTTIQKIAATLDAQLDGEAPDAEWAEAAESGIAAGIEQTGIAGVSLGDVECRSSICRLSLKFADEDTRNGSIATVVGSLPWHGVRFGRAIGGDPLTVVVYAAREGTDFPIVR